MKKIIILIFVFSIIFFFLCKNVRKKVEINYRITPYSIEIEENNNSNGYVYFYQKEFLIYRYKYDDTLYIGGFRNGKQEINNSNDSLSVKLLPIDRKNFAFSSLTIKNLDKERQKKIILSLRKFNSIYKLDLIENAPFVYLIKPKKKIIIEYKNNYPLEKGKYKIFLNNKAYIELLKLILIPKEFKLLDSDEIEDNPLEFEVK